MENYQDKYKKYKKKYLDLKLTQNGGKDNTSYFETIIIKETDILYHGTHNYIDGKLNNPAFFSKDILQSLGHILAPFCMRRKHLTERIIQGIFPMIYCYKAIRKLKLLKILKPHLSKDSFDLIYNIEILWKYLLKKENCVEILNEFYKRVKENSVETLDEEIINNVNLCEVFNKIMKIYKIDCSNGCFRGWVNVAGYYLLSMIDYKKYLKEIGLTHDDIDGFYVENDQDEIILFDTKLINKVEVYYVFPYKKCDLLVRDKVDYIKDYIYWKNEYNDNSSEYQFFIEFIIDYNTILDESNKWEFNWYNTSCEKYNPYEPISEDCKVVYDFETISTKISISYDQKDNVDYLKDYIEKIKQSTNFNFGMVISSYYHEKYKK